MYSILKLSPDDRRTVFRNTAQKMGVHEAIIEKDYWVCIVLDYLFHISRFCGSLMFKGGTSLSKCFDLIKRFSEDIDLILDWRILGYEKYEPWQERSKSKQSIFNKDANIRTAAFLSNEFLPAFTSELSDIIGERAIAEIEQSDLQTVCFHYPRLFSVGSIVQAIRLEVGTLAAWTPAVTRSVTPYVLNYYPQLSEMTSTTVIASTVERTFWEKVTILHHEANRPEQLDMPARYSRHYYDLYCIAQTNFKTSALDRLDLLQKVVEFKMKFYPRAWAKYEDAVPGSIRLIPPEFRFNTLRSDYKAMAEMLFGEGISFDELIQSLTLLEYEMNHH